VVATLVGTLSGTLLGAALSARRERAGRGAALAQQRLVELEEALAAADLAIAELNPTDIAVSVLADRGRELDRTAELLAGLQASPALRRASEGLALVRVRHPDASVRGLCEDLSRDLAWLQATVTGWFVARVVRGGGDMAAEELGDTHEDASAALATARRRRDRLAELARRPQG
jgi:hypothetical protein